MSFSFKPVKGWISSQLTEKIGDWNTKVYEASGKMVAVTRLKSSFRLPSGATFDSYLNTDIKDDEVMETQLNPSTLDPSEMAARRLKENKVCISHASLFLNCLSGRQKTEVEED